VILLDLALQGFQDLATATRVRLQSGYCAIVVPKFSPETVIRGIVAVLFGEAKESGPAKSSGGASVMGPDGTTLRVMRDFGVGTAQLLEFDRAAKAFKPLTSDLREIQATLTSRVLLPTREAFERVFVLRPRDLPSRAHVPEALPLSKKPPADPEVLRARLAEIDLTLANLKHVADLEFELDGLQKQRFDTEDRLKALAYDPTELEEARVIDQRTAYLDVLTPDAVQRFDNLGKLIERRDAELERWQLERDQLERQERQAEVSPLLGDWRLWAGLAAGSLAVVVGAELGSVWRYLALLDIPAYGLSAFLVFRHLNQREVREQLHSRHRLSDQRRERIVSRDAGEIAAVEAMLKDADVSSRAELAKALEMRRAVRERLQALTQAREAAVDNPEKRTLNDTLQTVMTRITAIEEELQMMAALPVDTTAMRTEADGIREELELLRPKPKAPPADSRAPLDAWFKAAQGLLLTDAEATARTLSERASLVVRALSGNRLVAVVYDAQGDTFIRSAQGSSAKWDALPEAARDLVYLSLRVGLFLALDPKARAPFLVEDLAEVLTGGLATEELLLATLAQAGQLVQIVRRPDQAPKAQHLVVAEVSA